MNTSQKRRRVGPQDKANDEENDEENDDSDKHFAGMAEKNLKVATEQSQTENRVATEIIVDENPELSATYGIRGIPALLFFRDGKPVDQVVGAVSKTVLVQHLNKVINSD